MRRAFNGRFGQDDNRFCTEWWMRCATSHEGRYPAIEESAERVLQL